MTRWTRTAHAREQGPLSRALRALVRRVTARASATGFWQVDGYDGERESDVEVFGIAGIASRPRANADIEALVLHVGGHVAHPVICATRDQSIAIELDADELALFNSTGAVVHVRASGDIAIRPAPGRHVLVEQDGAVEPLVTRAEFLGHGHPTAATGPVSGPVQSPAPSTTPDRFPGTQVLRAE